MGELLDDHESIRPRTYGIADTVDIIAGKVNKHDMFGSVFQTCPQLVSELKILSWGRTTFDRASNRMRNYASGVFFAFDKEFGRGSYKLKCGARNIKQVGRRIGSSELTIDVERMESCGPRYAMGRDSLYDRASLDLFLETCNMSFVSGLASVGFIGLIWCYWRLRRKRNVLGLEYRDCVAQVLRSGIISRCDGAWIRRG